MAILLEMQDEQLEINRFPVLKRNTQVLRDLEKKKKSLASCVVKGLEAAR